MEVREAALSDIEVVAQLRLEFLAAHRGVAAGTFSEQFRAETEAFVRRHQEAASLRSWLAESKGRQVGVASMLILDLAPRPEDASGREGYIINMYVDPGHRRQGVGSALLDSCFAAADALALRRLLLYATDDGRPMYTAAGFRPNPNWMELPLTARAPDRSAAQ